MHKNRNALGGDTVPTDAIWFNMPCGKRPQSKTAQCGHQSIM